MTTSPVRQHYATDTNLAGRQQLFAYAKPSGEPGMEARFTWPPDAVVLDVGCGNGMWTASVAARTPSGATVGLDVSAGMLASARGRAPSARWCQGDATALPFGDGVADAVLALWMLYHVPDKARALGEVTRVLKQGGRFLTATNANRALGQLEDIFTEAAGRTLGRSVDTWFPPLDFSLENGLDVLAPHFDRVETVVSTIPFSVPEVEPIVVYARTLRDPVVAFLGSTFDYDTFLGHVADLVRADLAHGPITFERRSVLFVAQDARR